MLTTATAAALACALPPQLQYEVTHVRQQAAASKLARALAYADLDRLERVLGSALRTGLKGELVDRAQEAVELCRELREACECQVRCRRLG